MFSIHNFWHLGFLVIVVAAFSIIGRYKTKNLPPKQKELRQLYYSFITFGIITVFLIFSLPFFYGFDYVPKEIKDLEEAQRILQNQSKSVEEMRDKLSEFKDIIYFFFIFFGMTVLQSIYNFAKAITPVEKENMLNLDAD
jgi:ubiquinone/menaquinone biosynthesis C-methylase UbiE